MNLTNPEPLTCRLRALPDPAEHVFVPRHALSRRARIFLPPGSEAITKVAEMIEQAAADDELSGIAVAVDDFIAASIVSEDDGYVTSAAAVAACRAYLLARGVRWPGDSQAAARIKAGILARFGVAQRRDSGSVRGWPHLAMWKQGDAPAKDGASRSAATWTFAGCASP